LAFGLIKRNEGKIKKIKKLFAPSSSLDCIASSPRVLHENSTHENWLLSPITFKQ